MAGQKTKKLPPKNRGAFSAISVAWTKRREVARSQKKKQVREVREACGGPPGGVASAASSEGWRGRQREEMQRGRGEGGGSGGKRAKKGGACHVEHGPPFRMRMVRESGRKPRKQTCWVL
jgi:hypothetical protein